MVISGQYDKKHLQITAITSSTKFVNTSIFSSIFVLISMQNFRLSLAALETDIMGKFKTNCNNEKSDYYCLIST